MTFVDGVASDGFSDGFLDVPPVGGDTPPSGFVVPPGVPYALELSAADSAYQSVQFSDGNQIVRYRRFDATPTQKDHLRFDESGRVRVSSGGSGTRSIELTAVRTQDVAEIALTASALALAADDSVAFSLTAERQLDLANPGGAKSYDLDIELVSAEGETLFRSSGVPLGAGVAHSTDVDWDSFDGSDITINVDEDGDGNTDTQFTLTNEITETSRDDRNGADTGDGADGLPAEFALAQNYPNPVAQRTKIAYTLPEAAGVRLAVYDVVGREVAVLVDANKAAGRFEVEFDASFLSNGVYLIRLQANAFAATRSMVVVR